METGVGGAGIANPPLLYPCELHISRLGLFFQTVPATHVASLDQASADQSPRPDPAAACFSK